MIRKSTHLIGSPRWVDVHVARRSVDAFAGLRRPFIPGSIVAGATFFNACLAVINAHVFPMTALAVIGIEIFLVTAAHAVALLNYRRDMTRWYILIWCLLIIAIIRAICMGGTFDARSLRDVLLIPTFIILGLTYDSRSLPTLVNVLIAVTAVFMLLEAISLSSYSWLFEIQHYYISTRGLTQDDFWNKESPLFLSATRAGGRYFNVIDLHRLSSVFLEPVGAETFCIVVWTFICSFYARMRPVTRWTMIAIVLLMIAGCDGRLALVTSIIVAAAALMSVYLPTRLPFFYLPIVTGCVVSLVYMAGWRFTEDDFAGRLALSAHILFDMEASDVLGLAVAGWSADSGIGHLVTTQSIFGTILLWGFLTLGAKQSTPTQARYLHATALWLSLFMMVSFTFLTIKAAALLWFIFGSLQREEETQIGSTG
jgi:putative polymerase